MSVGPSTAATRKRIPVSGIGELDGWAPGARTALPTRGGFERWRRCLAAALVRARAEGTLAPDVDTEAVARFLVAGIEGAILLTKVQKDIGVMEHCVAELRRHLVLSRRPEVVVPAGTGR